MSPREARLLLIRAAKTTNRITAEQIEAPDDETFFRLAAALEDLRCLVSWRDWAGLDVFLAWLDSGWGGPTSPPENAGTSFPAKRAEVVKVEAVEAEQPRKRRFKGVKLGRLKERNQR
jgi:hypothetical protein